MLVAYLLLFLLHLSVAPACVATSRNQRLFLAGAAEVHVPSPVIHDRRHAAKDLAFYDVHYHPAMMARRVGPPPPPPPPSPGVGVSGGVEGARPPPSLPGVEASGVGGAPPPPPEKEDDSAAMSPSPYQDDDSGGGEGGTGTSSSEGTGTEEQESAADDVGVDYEGPKTHPPSHN